MFLNVHTIRKLAARKGCTVWRTATIKERPYVAIYDSTGAVIPGAVRGTGFRLAEAVRLLEALPDSP